MSKNYLIIGATSGIGNALAHRLTEAGHTIHSASRQANPEGLPPMVLHHQLDVTIKNPSFPDMGKQLDGLIYLPGTINLKPFHGLKPADFLSELEVNLLGAVKTLQHYRKVLRKTKGSSVLLFSTVAVEKGMSFHTSIAAAKGAVEGLARSLAAEWAPHVRVNCIAPSLTDTPLAERLLRNDQQREANAERHPLNRVGKPEDIAAMAEFLLSEQAAWITGQVMHVDGGLSTLG